MEKKMFVNSWGKSYEITRIEINEYSNNKNLAIQLICKDEEFGGEEPFARLTTNISQLPKGYACVDTNNCPWAEQFIQQYQLGKSVGYSLESGFCSYPIYKFDLSKLAWYK